VNIVRKLADRKRDLRRGKMGPRRASVSIGRTFLPLRAWPSALTKAQNTRTRPRCYTLRWNGPLGNFTTFRPSTDNNSSDVDSDRNYRLQNGVQQGQVTDSNYTSEVPGGN
jgi:hypothetical protein